MYNDFILREMYCNVNSSYNLYVSWWGLKEGLRTALKAIFFNLNWKGFKNILILI